MTTFDSDANKNNVSKKGKSRSSSGKDKNRAKKRRRHPRVKCDWKLKVITPEKQVLAARCKNISIAGILIELPEKFVRGDNLYLEIQAFFLGEQKLIKVVGRVIYVVFRSGHFDVGLKFATDTSEFHHFLKDYVRTKTE